MRARWQGVAALIAGLVVTSAAAASVSGVRHRDPVGDVKRGPGPDITAVTAFEQAGRIKFRVEFAKAPPLAFSAKSGFTDMLVVTIFTTGRTGAKQPHYWLGVHGADLAHVILSQPPKEWGGQGEDFQMVRMGPAVVSGKSVTLSVAPRRIGDPKTIRFSVAAGREMNQGTGGGDDLSPEKGTWLFVR